MIMLRERCCLKNFSHLSVVFPGITHTSYITQTQRTTTTTCGLHTHSSYTLCDVTSCFAAPGHGFLHDAVPADPSDREEVRRLTATRSQLATPPPPPPIAHRLSHPHTPRNPGMDSGGPLLQPLHLLSSLQCPVVLSASSNMLP